MATVQSPSVDIPMQTLEPDAPASQQLWGRSFHVPNVDSTAVNGDPTEDMTSTLRYYGLRFGIALSDGDIMAVPSEAVPRVRENMAYLHERDLTTATPDAIIGVEMQHGETIAAALARDIHINRRKYYDDLAGVRSVTPFTHSPEVASIASAFGLSTDRTYRPSEATSNKAFAIHELERRGIPVVRGSSAFSRAEFNDAFACLKSKDGAVKLSRSASSEGIFRFEVGRTTAKKQFYRNKQIARDCMPGSYEHAGIASYQQFTPGNAIGVRVEEWMEDVDSSPGVVIYVGQRPAQDRLIAVSDQILNDSKAHIGNVWSPKIWSQDFADVVPRVADWAREVGGFGVIGIDFVVTKDGRAFVVELNGRITGQTHHALAVQNLLGTTMPHDAVWAGTCENMPAHMTLRDFIAELDARDIGYDPAIRRGVAVLSHGVGKVGSNKPVSQLFHLAGDMDEFEHQRRIVREIAAS